MSQTFNGVGVGEALRVRKKMPFCPLIRQRFSRPYRMLSPLYNCVPGLCNVHNGRFNWFIRCTKQCCEGFELSVCVGYQQGALFISVNAMDVSYPESLLLGAIGADL